MIFIVVCLFNLKVLLFEFGMFAPLIVFGEIAPKNVVSQTVDKFLLANFVIC